MKKSTVFRTTVSAALCLTLASGAVMPKQALAWDWLSAGLALFQVGAEYAYLNKQVSYLDNNGRDKYMGQIKDKYGVNTDPAANAMLARIMTRLSDAVALTDESIVKKPYNYFVNNDKSFNAFCTLGHNMSVNIGAFTKLNYNEDELAFVIAHEMGHGQKNHPAAGVKRALPVSIVAALYASQNRNTASSVGAALVSTVGTAKWVTKPMESQADKLAFDYAVAAGYNVGAGAALWQHILEQNGSKSSGFAELFNDHPTSLARRTNYNKKITEWSGKQVKVNEENGLISVMGQPFYTPEKTSTMSPQEQAFLIAGNLSSVFHEGRQYEPVWTNSENTLLVGERPVMSFDGVVGADEVEKRLREILSSSKNAVKLSAGMQMENKKDKTEPNRSIKAEARTNTDDKAARPMTMREKVEAYKAGTF
ncbi:M48 family metallopeptidase [Succiniclasticum ruminis]|uniref:Peptidase family M48 n=1 Tax=Succiniclasticum ruminis DSM 9236 TaxID=1123323 RepID=A0A1I1XGZ1_9FIRM|nr:M48 family metallopeptidase [Succiniclasticum ruminis]SFE05928.1 Peptidase family M48 [Succiniclasticum ruminis DSM 9236]